MCACVWGGGEGEREGKRRNNAAWGMGLNYHAEYPRKDSEKCMLVLEDYKL